MKVKQIIVFEAPNDYEHLDDLEVAAIDAAENKTLPELLDSIKDEDIMGEQVFNFPDDIDGDTASNALFGSLCRRLKNMGKHPYEDYYLDFALIEIDGVWRNLYQYDDNAKLIYFK